MFPFFWLLYITHKSFLTINNYHRNLTKNASLFVIRLACKVDKYYNCLYFEANNLNILPDILSQERHSSSRPKGSVVTSSASRYNLPYHPKHPIISDDRPQPAPRARARRYSAVQDTLTIPNPVPKRRSRSITNPVARKEQLEHLQHSYHQYKRAESPLLSPPTGSKSLSRSRSARNKRSPVSNNGGPSFPRKDRRATVAVAQTDQPYRHALQYDDQPSRAYSEDISSALKDFSRRRESSGKIAYAACNISSKFITNHFYFGDVVNYTVLYISSLRSSSL